MGVCHVKKAVHEDKFMSHDTAALCSIEYFRNVMLMELWLTFSSLISLIVASATQMLSLRTL